MSFDILSNELIVEIFCHLLATPDSSKALWATSVCSRRCFELAQPILYSKVVQTGTRSLPAYIRTIVAKPHLAQHLRHFHGRHPYSRPYFRGKFGGLDLDLSLLTRSETKWIRSFLPDNVYGRRFCDEWYQRLFAPNNWDCLVAVLLRIWSSNLESLSLEHCIEDWKGNRQFSYITTVMEMMGKGQNTPDNSSFMPKLRTVHINPQSVANDDHRPLTVEFILPFLKLKSVAEFSGSGINSGDDNDYPYPTAEQPNGSFGKILARDVKLCNMELRGYSVLCFLRSFCSLRSFEYNHFDDMFSGELEVFHVINSLTHLKNSLEELAITSEAWGWYTNSSFVDENIDLNEDTETLLGSLTDFEKLRSIKSNARHLVGLDYCGGDLHLPDANLMSWFYTAEQVAAFLHSLPASLERLTIIDCTTAIFQCLPALFSQSHISDLKMIHLAFRLGSPIEPRDKDGRYWEEAALENGIVLTREKGPEGDPSDFRPPS